jgi:hypothetical protein
MKQQSADPWMKNKIIIILFMIFHSINFKHRISYLWVGLLTMGIASCRWTRSETDQKSALTVYGEDKCQKFKPTTARQVEQKLANLISHIQAYYAEMNKGVAVSAHPIVKGQIVDEELTIEAPVGNKGIKIIYITPNQEKLEIFMDKNLLFPEAIRYTHLEQTGILNFIDRDPNNCIRNVNVQLITKVKQSIINSANFLRIVEHFDKDDIKFAYSDFAHTLANYLELFELFHNRCRTDLLPPLARGEVEPWEIN